jgi:hypothetical protein
MKSDELAEAYYEHIASLLFIQPVDEGQLAILYGTDEFAFDAKNGRIRLPEMGWIKCGHIPKAMRKRAGWVAALPDGKGWSLLVGDGNPYKLPTSESRLPARNGAILATPYRLPGNLLAGQLDDDTLAAFPNPSNP